jgi:hypothetical protein
MRPPTLSLSPQFIPRHCHSDGMPTFHCHEIGERVKPSRAERLSDHVAVDPSFAASKARLTFRERRERRLRPPSLSRVTGGVRGLWSVPDTFWLLEA